MVAKPALKIPKFRKGLRRDLGNALQPHEVFLRRDGRTRLQDWPHFPDHVDQGRKAVHGGVPVKRRQREQHHAPRGERLRQHLVDRIFERAHRRLPLFGFPAHHERGRMTMAFGYTHVTAPPDRFRLPLLPLLHQIEGRCDRPVVAIRAALSLMIPGQSWALNGRGPSEWDDLGFVRACVQAALAWDEAEGVFRRDTPSLDDILLPVPVSPAARVGHFANNLRDLFTAWGLLRSDMKAARPGDLVLFSSHFTEAGCGILVRNGGDRSRPDTIALVRPGEPPTLHTSYRAQVAICAFAWPEA